jgi:FAD/FMN-containing dehydrogenase
VVAHCRDNDISIVPQGGNTGLSGGQIPFKNSKSIVLSMARMNQIEEVNANRFAMTAQTGCTLQNLQEAASDVDRMFAVDLGARGTATVGGAIGTNAGGLNVLRYGSARDQIMGLEVVLPNGEVWDGLRALRKDATGYDLKHWFIGSEGTLGVVTRAVLKLHPKPRHKQSAFLALAGIDKLMELYARARALGVLDAFELIPETGIAAANKTIPSAIRPLETTAEWYVLMRLAGVEPIDNMFVTFLERGLEDGLLVDAAVSNSEGQEQKLWLMRDEILPTNIFPGKKLKYDVAVPIDRIADYQAALVKRVAEVEPAVLTYAFGHVGDGNLHVSIIQNNAVSDEVFDAKTPDIQDAVDQLTWAFEGTISAEHGIGQDLVKRVAGQKSEIEWSMMRQFKATIDPKGMMNPGKMI